MGEKKNRRRPVVSSENRERRLDAARRDGRQIDELLRRVENGYGNSEHGLVGLPESFNVAHLRENRERRFYAARRDGRQIDSCVVWRMATVTRSMDWLASQSLLMWHICDTAVRNVASTAKKTFCFAVDAGRSSTAVPNVRRKHAGESMEASS